MILDPVRPDNTAEEFIWLGGVLVFGLSSLNAVVVVFLAVQAIVIAKTLWKDRRKRRAT